MGTVISEMSSWKALTWHTGMKTAFDTKNMKSKYFGLLIIKILYLRVIEENAYLMKYSTYQQGTVLISRCLVEAV